MSIKSTGDSTLPPIKTEIVSPSEGQTLTYKEATGTWVNGLQFTIVKPTITSPSNASPLTAGNANSFVSSAFSIVPTQPSLVHVSSDWQIASDAEFSNIMHSSIGDTTNKTTWSQAVDSGFGTVYVRVRYYNGQEYSEYSDTVAYSVFQVYSYTSTQTIAVPNNTNTMIVEMVGGGAGGSVNAAGHGGGVTKNASVTVTPGSNVVVTVGAGTVGRNAAGASSFGNLNTASGANANTSGNGFTGNEGGAGAGGNANAATSDYLSRYSGGGGAGVAFNIDGSTRGGGGGGGANFPGYFNRANTPGVGQAGGGNGNGGQISNQAVSGQSGTNAFGGGGGGSPNNASNSTGGNGVVIVKYTS
jgi:hypothetical protein